MHGGLPRRAAAFLAAASSLLALLVLVPAQPAGAVVRDTRVYMLGDSVMHGAPDAIRRALPGWDTTINTFVGRFLHHGLQTLRDERGRIDDVAVIHLGNNYLGDPVRFGQQVDEAMRILDGVDEVIWLNVHNNNPEHRGEINAALAGAAERWPHLVIADWYGTAVANQPGAVYPDGTHLPAKGQALYADLIARHLVDWLSPSTRCRAASIPAAQPSPASGRGYWLLDTNGSVHAYHAPHLGDLRSRGVAERPVAIQSTPSGEGYWIVDRRGGVHAFGDADYRGGLADQRLNGPIRAIEASPSGDGYWLVASDGGVFSFGAPFRGSTGDQRLNSPVRSMAADPDGDGYWLIAADGGVFSFAARFHGSTGAMRLSAPVVSLAADPRGRGYWLYARDGGVFSFGLPFHGSLPGLGFCHTPSAVQLRPTDTGGGYWIVTKYGEVYSFGDAAYHGGSPALAPGVRVLDLAVRHSGG